MPTVLVIPDMAHCAELQRAAKSNEEPAPQPTESSSALGQRPDIPPPPAGPEVSIPEADSTDETRRQPPQIPQQPPIPEQPSAPTITVPAQGQPFPPEPTGDKVIFEADHFSSDEVLERVCKVLHSFASSASYRCWYVGFAFFGDELFDDWVCQENFHRRHQLSIGL